MLLSLSSWIHYSSARIPSDNCLLASPVISCVGAHLLQTSTMSKAKMERVRISINYKMILIQFIKQMSLQAVQAAVSKLANAVKAKQMMRFFKTGPGEYGEGDVFLGLTNPECREIAANNKNMSNKQIAALLSSKIHEDRFIALVVMDHKFKKAENQEQMYKIYLNCIAHINNWDLVDLSAPNIIGKYIYSRCSSFQEIKTQDDPRTLLYTLVKSPSLWQRRISIISTLTFIRKGQFYDTLQLSKLLLSDKEDLIHKAVGWMLREVGKRDQPLLQSFLKTNYNQIPRTSLRYSIEKFQEPQRLKFLKGDF